MRLYSVYINPEIALVSREKVSRSKKVAAPMGLTFLRLNLPFYTVFANFYSSTVARKVGAARRCVACS